MNSNGVDDVVKANGWRSCCRPPRHFDTVLVYTRPTDVDGRPSCNGIDKNGGMIGLGWYQIFPKGEWEGWVCEDLPRGGEPLFWRPLPKPPEFK